MPAQYRLSRTDFARMRGFIRVHGTLFSLSFGTIAERAVPGVACVVSAKTIPHAVVRNRVKRRCRAILAPHISSFVPSFVVVVYAKKAAAKATFVESQSEITTLLQKAGITSRPNTG